MSHRPLHIVSLVTLFGLVIAALILALRPSAVNSGGGAPTADGSTPPTTVAPPALLAPTSGVRAALPAGSGAFVADASELDSRWSEDVALGDLDGDGDLDIFLAHRDEASSTWFNDGTGRFTANGINLGNDFLIDVALGDVDGDDDLDVILAGIQNNGLWLNDGHGSFSYGGEIFASSRTIVQVALGDLDGDGDLDAATATICDPFDPDQACVYSASPIWWNDGRGNFTLSGQSLGSGTAADIALGDLDGDDDLDAVVVHAGTPGSAVWQNMGDGLFTLTQPLPTLSAGAVSLADLDGDRDLDAFVAPTSGAVSAVWLNDGAGILEAGQTLGSLGPAQLGDLDGDGDVDAFVYSSGAWTWFNQGNGDFVFGSHLQNDLQTTGVALGDLDQDGDLDAVSSGYDAAPYLWINDAPTAP